jgi:uncharacterized protein
MIVFFLIAFCVPWATLIAARRAHVAFPEGTPVFMLGLAFCSLAGVIATYIESGHAGLKKLAKRCTLYRVPVVWWLFALFLPMGVHAIATLIYGVAHGGVGAIRPMEIFHQWWLFYVFAFGLLQGPLGEELSWRGFLLPRLLNRFSPLGASVILGVIWGVWHLNVLFSPPSTIALFAASAVALSVLMTVLFLHTRGSVLLAIVMHWSVVPTKDIVRISFPAAPQPPDWLRAVVVITIALLAIAITRGKLYASSPKMDSELKPL